MNCTFPLRVTQNWKLWLKHFAIVNHIGCTAVMAVKLKEHPQMHVYFSGYLELSLIWPDGNMFAEKLQMCVLIGLTTAAIFLAAN